jgi:hypothetical protein
MASPSAMALLVGKGARHPGVLLAHLQSLGCEPHFATSCEEAISMIGRRAYDLVLSERMLTDGTGYRLIPHLMGSKSSLFVSEAMDDGAWWSPIVYKGISRAGDSAIQAGRFLRMLGDIVLGNPPKAGVQPGSANGNGASGGQP